MTAGGGAGGGGGDGGGGATIVRHTDVPPLPTSGLLSKTVLVNNRHVFPETTKPLQVVSGGGGDGGGMGGGGGDGGMDSNPQCVIAKSDVYSVYARLGNSRASVA